MPAGVYERKPNKNEQVLMFGIVSFFLDKQRFPTLRECVTFTDYASFSTIQYTLKRLERKGKLKSEKVNKHTHYIIVGLTIKPPDWYVEVKK